jgi:putative endonuclease
MFTCFVAPTIRITSDVRRETFKGYTFSRRPVVLVWSEHFERITDAIAVERQLKGWSRAKKDALLRSDWTKVIELSRRRVGKMKSG